MSKPTVSNKVILPRLLDLSLSEIIRQNRRDAHVQHVQGERRS